MKIPSRPLLGIVLPLFIFLAGVRVVATASGEQNDNAPTVAELRETLKKNPEDRAALYNLGLMDYLDGRFFEALKSWEKLKPLEPEDWKLRAKLVQAYWAAGKPAAADREIEELRKCRSSGKYKDLSEQKFFIRDQFSAGGVNVSVLEYYDLAGERPLVWKFFLQKEGETLDHFYSLGSYETTTEAMRAMKRIAPKDRGYHLDGYSEGGSHETFGIYTKKPEYGKIREMVVSILKGELEPQSSINPAPKAGSGSPEPAPAAAPAK